MGGWRWRSRWLRTDGAIRIKRRAKDSDSFQSEQSPRKDLARVLLSSVEWRVLSAVVPLVLVVNLSCHSGGVSSLGIKRILIGGKLIYNDNV